MKSLSKNWIGVLLIVFGIAMLLDQLDITTGVSGSLWGLLFLIGGVYLLADQRRTRPLHAWKLFPAMVFIGMGLEAILPSAIGFLDGAVFLSALGVAFLLFMLDVPQSWWASIPAGVFFSLALGQLLENTINVDAGGVFLIGLGATFFTLALVPIEGERREWGYIPGIVLVILGGLQYYTNIQSPDLVFPILLIAAGVMFLLRFALVKRK